MELCCLENEQKVISLTEMPQFYENLSVIKEFWIYKMKNHSFQQGFSFRTTDCNIIAVSTKFSIKTLNLIISDESHKHFMRLTDWQLSFFVNWGGKFSNIFEKAHWCSRVLYQFSDFKSKFKTAPTKQYIATNYIQNDTQMFWFAFVLFFWIV